MAFVRINGALIADAERRLALRIVARLPAWVTPDHCTFGGLAGACAAGIGFALSNASPAWLWLGVAGIFVSWWGDSLDGNLARTRNIQRPKYGAFVDHLTDALSQLAIFGGIALSPYAQAWSALLALTAYWLLTLLTLITALTAGDFRISYLGVGPTEIRILLILGTILHWLAGPMTAAATAWGALSFFDACFAGAFALVWLPFLISAVGTGRALSAQDPRPRR
jgi:phosphatidylglycerophosphate synthase